MNQFNFNRDQFARFKQKVAENRVAMQQAMIKKRLKQPFTLERFFRGIFGWFKGFLTPVARIKPAVRLDQKTVPIGFEAHYDCCGIKLVPVWKRKRRGGRYHLHHFKCLTCGSTTVNRW